MHVLVNGIGNIGTTLLNLLLAHKGLLQIDKIYALKNANVQTWNRAELDILQSKGVILCSKENSDFELLEEVIDSIDYIFDCNANSIGLKNKPWYKSLTTLKGASAQGSEKDFGMSYMYGINDDLIGNHKFAHIVSCNTHAIAAILSLLGGENFENIKEADFVVVRRSEDLGNHQRLVTANVVSRHREDEIGTHHAVDVKDLLEIVNVDLNIQSSDITTPTQLMHTVRFNVQLEKMLSQEEFESSIEVNPCIAKTVKFDSNVVFELGRRYSPSGRIFSQAIVNHNNLLFDTKNKRIKGWAFIPQEGNTLLSTLAAFLFRMNPNQAEVIMHTLVKELCIKEW